MIGDRIYIFYSEVFEIILSENNYDWITFKDEYVSIYLAKNGQKSLNRYLLNYLIHKLNYYDSVILLSLKGFY